MTKLPSRFLIDEVRRQWLAQPPVRRRRAHVEGFGQSLLASGMRLAPTPALHQEYLLKIVRTLVEPDA